ncbi:putative ATP-dependent helicase C23E6.02 [Tuber brumale]|nr:putative ATP-dependent helicase C23E6.02 [Tuber brumale]
MKRNREDTFDHFHQDFPETKSQRTTPSPSLQSALLNPNYVGVRHSLLSRDTGISDEEPARSSHAELNSPRVGNGMSFNNAGGSSDQSLPSINSGLAGMCQSNSDANYSGRGLHPRRHEEYMPRASLRHAGSSNGASSSYLSEYDDGGYAYSDSGYLDNTLSPALLGGLPKPSATPLRFPHVPANEVIELLDSDEESETAVSHSSLGSLLPAQDSRDGSVRPFDYSNYDNLATANGWNNNGTEFDDPIIVPNNNSSQMSQTPDPTTASSDNSNQTPQASDSSAYGGIVDRDGNPLNSGWPSTYRPEIGNYINHIRGDPTKTLDQLKTLMENIRPDMEIPPENREGTPDDMTYPLMEHQKLGLAWLKGMEDGSNKGGILADDMGLGKTIQALALIVSRKSKDPDRKTTLIVAPIALLKQWEREIEKKLKPEHCLKVIIHHGNQKKCKSFEGFKDYDVVLTTFGTIGTEYKKKQALLESEDQEAIGKANFFFVGDHCEWYRVIIDEAQCIKNKDTQSAKGCCALNAKFRLCLSGTPMQNSCDEMFSLLRFLRIEPYNSWPEFSNTFSRPLKSKSERAVSSALLKLQALMKAVLLRRTKDSTIDGKPILTLPDKNIEMVHAILSPDEQQFYQALQDKSKILYNKYLRAGTVGRNYSNILVLLLRLRQACCHPHLIRDIEKPFDDQMIELAKSLSPEAVARLKDPDAFECPICLDAADNPSIVVPCGHQFCSECLVLLHTQHVKAAIASGNEEGGARCPGCRGAFQLNKVIDLRTFQKVYMPEGEEVAPEEPKEEYDDDLIYDTDSSEDSDDDGDTGSDLEDFIVNDEEVDSDEQGEGSAAASASEDGGQAPARKATAPKKRKKDIKGKGKAKEKSRPRTLAEVRKDAMRNAKSKKQYMKHLQKRWISSAKKTIVFSQFTSLLDLIEIPIHQKGWTYRRYDGGMTSTARNEALTEFTDDPNVNIILVSLKAGNSGLNLVAASQVIILDPFYNPFIENQAIDRAHRIGQQRKVRVHKLIVAGTVEDRVLALQEEKRKLIEGALDENASKGIGRLSTKDLGFLFGIESR